MTGVLRVAACGCGVPGVWLCPEAVRLWGVTSLAHARYTHGMVPVEVVQEAVKDEMAHDDEGPEHVPPDEMDPLREGRTLRGDIRRTPRLGFRRRHRRKR